MKCILFFHLIIITTCGYSFSQVKESKKPVISFRSTIISFDTINAGERIKAEFVFINSGDTFLFIERVLGSDGGTLATWSNEIYKPGDSGIIKVDFGYTRSRSGTQDKIFTVLSNAANGPITLHWKGYIRKADQE